MLVNAVFDALYAFWNQIVYAVSNMRFPFDIIDILVIAFIIYKAVGFLRESRAGQLVKGIVLLLVIYLIATWWQLTTVKWLLSSVVDSIIIAAAVIFQPELRDMLEEFDEAMLLKAIDKRVFYGMNYFVQPEQAMHFKDPQLVLGSFVVREDKFRIRIDDIQHFMGGYYLYYKNYKTVKSYTENQ